MKKYNLSIFSGTGSINTSVTAKSISVKDNLICFYNEKGDLISAFPVNLTAILSIQEYE